MIIFFVLALIYFFSAATSRINRRLPPDIYVALGDSYATGLGAGHHQKADDPYDDCLLYDQSYPHLFHTQIQGNRGRRLKNLACARQYIEDFDWYMADVLPQIDRGASLISVQLGLDYVRIYNAVISCDEHYTWRCAKHVALAEIRAEYRFYTEMLSSVRKLRLRAGDALIVIFGYPRFYGDSVKDCDPSGKGAKGKWSGAYKDRINMIILQINVQLANVVGQLHKEGHTKVVLKVPDGDFVGHRYCDKDPWFISHKQAARNTKLAFFGGYCHPNVEGHKKYMELLNDAWQNEGLTVNGECVTSQPGHCLVSDDEL